MTKEELEAMSEEGLDDLVIDFKLAEASAINNGGKEEQIAYLTGEE